MGISVGSVQVDVVPAALNFARDLGSRLIPAAREIGLDMGEQMAREISQYLARAADPNRASYARAGEVAGESFATALSAEIREAVRSLPNIHLGANATDAEIEIAAIRRQLDELSRQRIGIDVDETLARAQIDELRGRLIALQSSATIPVNANIDGAVAHLDTFRAIQEREPVRVPVEAETRTADAELAIWRNLIAKQLKLKLQAQADTGAAWQDIKQFVGRVSDRFAWLDSIVKGVAKLSIGTFGAAAAVSALGSVGGAVMSLIPIIGLIPAAGTAAIATVATLKIGLGGVGDALKNAFDPTKAKQFNEAMAKLSPNAREFVNQLRAMGPALHALKMDVQNRLFAGLGTTVRQLGDTYLPMARGGFASMADTINVAVKNAAGLLRTPEAVGALQVVTDNVGIAFKNLSGALTPVLSAFITIARVGSGSLPGIANVVASLAERFNAFIQNAARVGDLRRWFELAVQAAGNLFQILGNVASILGSVFSAGASSGANLLTTVRDITGSIAVFLRTAQGATLLRSLFDAANQAMRAAQPLFVAIGQVLVNDILPAVVQVLPSIGQALGALAPVMGPLGEVLKNLAPLFAYIAQSIAGQLVTALNLAMPFLLSFSRFLGQNPGLVYGFVSALGPLTIVFGVLHRVISAFMTPLALIRLAMIATGKGATELTSPLAKIGESAKTVAGKVLEFIKPMRLAETLFRVLGGVATNLFKALIGGFGPVSALITIFTILFTTNAQFRDAIMNLLGVIGQLVSAVATALSPIFAAFASGPGVSFGQIIGDIATGLATVLVPAINALASWIQFITPVLAPLIMGFLAIVAAIKGWAIAQAALDIAMNANPIGMLVIAIALLVGGVVAAYQHFAWFRDIVQACWSGISTAASAVWNGFLRPIFTAIGVAIGWVVDHWRIFAIAFLVILGPIGLVIAAFTFFRTQTMAVLSAIGTVLKWIGAIVLTVLVAPFVIAFNIISSIARGLWTLLQPVLTGIGNLMVWLYQTIVVPIWGAIRAFIDAEVQGIVNIWNFYIVPALRFIASLFTWFWTAVVLPVWNGIRAAIEFEVQGIVNVWNFYIVPALRFVASIFMWFWSAIIMPVWGWIRGLIQAEVNGIVNIWNSYLMPAIRFLGSVFSWLNDNVVQPVWRGISGAISGAWDFIKGIYTYLTTGTNGIGQVFQSVSDWIGRAWNAIREATRAPVQWVIDVVYNRGVMPIWNGIAGVFGLPKLGPVFMESGGIVPMVTNRPTAIVGEGDPRYPEYVIPTDPKYRDRSSQLWQAAGSDLGYYASGGVVGQPTGHPVQLLEGGGVLGTIGDILDIGGQFIGELFTKGPAAAVRDLFAGPSGDGNRIPGIGGLHDAMAGVVPKTVDAVIAKAKALYDSMMAGGGAGVQRWAGVVAQALNMTGQPQSLMGATLRRMNQESGGNPVAVNRTDVNWQRGTPSVGLMQVIGPTFRANAGPFRGVGPFMFGTSVNPLANVYASMRYAIGRYGGLAPAYNKAGGYDLGGIASGVGMLPKYTPAPERVLSPQQTRSFDRLVTNLAPTNVDSNIGGTGGEFRGNLYLDSGEFLGAVNGQIDQAHGDAARQLTFGRNS